MEGWIEFFRNYWSFVTESLREGSYLALLTDLRILGTAGLLLLGALLLRARRFVTLFVASYLAALLAAYTFPRNFEGGYDLPNKADLVLFLAGIVLIAATVLYLLFIREE